MTLFKYCMKQCIKYILVLLIVLLFLIVPSIVSVNAQTSDVDVTTSSVRDDLESMDMDKLSYLSDVEYKFITMSQYYDKSKVLHSYLYVNLPLNSYNNENPLYADISVSVMDEDYVINEEFKRYELSYVNNDETWYKLEIKNLPNLELTTRRYFINSIGYIVNNDLYSSVLNVEQTFIYNGINNKDIQVFHEEIETITITEKEVQFYCWGDGDEWSELWGYYGRMESHSTYTDAWYIFFNTDKPIDELMEIELTYTKYDYKFNYLQIEPYINMDYAYTEKELTDFINSDNLYAKNCYINYDESKKVTITPGKEKIESIDKEWFGQYDYHYKELDNILDLRKKHEDMGDGFVFTEQSKKYTWGVHFLSTTKINKEDVSAGYGFCNIYGSGVCDTAILRLKFKTDGIIKNCYAIDVPTDDFTGNATDAEDDFAQVKEWFEKILMLIAIFILVVLIGYLTPIFKTIWEVLIKVLKVIVKIILIPFELIGYLFKKKK